MAGRGWTVGCATLLAFAVGCGGWGAQAGDPAKGRQAFVDLQCNACHEVKGESFPPPAVVPAVTLGGRMLLPPSDGKLRDDILIPSSHYAVGYPSGQITKDGRSRMPEYSKTLTDEQVADLIAFLRTHYERGLPAATR
jgi:mono/diheme cytochrome c family protein